MTNVRLNFKSRVHEEQIFIVCLLVNRRSCTRDYRSMPLQKKTDVVPIPDNRWRRRSIDRKDGTLSQEVMVSIPLLPNPSFPLLPFSLLSSSLHFIQI